MRFTLSILGALILTAPFAFAQDDYDEISIYGSVCEKIDPSESKSSARTRATDKATFKALQDLPILDNYRQSVSPQDLSTKIYQLADNYLTGVTINTTSQDDKEICVEVNAFLLSDGIEKIFKQDKIIKNTEEKMSVDDDFSISLPPKPQITINQDIAYDEEPQDNRKTSAKQAITAEQNDDVKRDVSDKQSVQIFVDRTEFFDGNSTTQFFEHIKSELEQINGTKVTAQPENPDYILKSKVLKAKVDALNSSTNRLQIVVSLTLTDVKTQESFTEHQNRFVLFSSEDDAQKTAAALIRKLIAAGMVKLRQHIETKVSTAQDGLITTPR